MKMLFIDAIIAGAGFYIGWTVLKSIDQILYKKYGKAIQKIIKIDAKKNHMTHRPIGFNSKWEGS